jgi:hypothetical protein
VTNFASDFTDGTVLAALIGVGVENAFDAAQTLGVAPVLDRDSLGVDELSTMLLVALLRRALWRNAVNDDDDDDNDDAADTQGDDEENVDEQNTADSDAPAPATPNVTPAAVSTNTGELSIADFDIRAQ